MVEFFRGLFSSDFMPHGSCYLWDPGVLWLNVVSDALIGLAYFAIPVLLLAFFRRRRDITFSWVFAAFAVFIVACGTTHFMAVWTVWHGTYRLDGVIKAITALASVLTAIVLVPLFPVLAEMPSPSVLAEMNRQLEERVAERTRALELSNASLEGEVAERRRMEVALEESEEQYRLLFENNPQAMWVYDVATLGFLTVNAAAIARYGYSREQFLGMTIEDIRPSEEISRLRETVSKHSSGLGHATEWMHRTKDGAQLNVEITSQALPFTGKQARLVLAADVTERRRLEEQLRQAQRMEAVGRLAGGVAHDFNNLLTVIVGYGGLVREAMNTPGADLREMMNEINRAADRAAALTRQLLAFSRQQVLLPRVLDLNRVMADLSGMLRRLIAEDIEISIIPGEALGRVKADSGQIEQVIVNLAVNARDAMPGGGRLILETGNADLTEGYVGRHATVKPGRYVVLTVTDTGTGVDEKARAHIFEPFFTTKEPGKGTGLGLATVYGIVKQSGGHIWLYSEPGRGATFRIYLPRVEDDGAGVLADVIRDPMEALRGSECILLVEDDASVRVYVRKVLEDNGYRVLEARDGAEAVRLAAGETRIHLLITDVVMPGMGGGEIAAKLVSRRAGLKVLYMSGYTNDAAVLQDLLDAKAPYIQKPFSPQVLARRVRSVLDGTAG